MTRLRFAAPVTLDYVPEWVLGTLLDQPRSGLSPVRPTITRIQQAVCSHLNVTMADLLALRRKAALVRKRHIAMYLAATLTERSLPEIGRAFGNRDHTTILHAKRKVAALLAAGDERLAADIAEVERMLGVREEGGR